VDVRDDERLTEHLDHRDRRANRRFETELHAAFRRSGEEIGASPRQQLLVRGDHGLAGAEEVEDVAAGRFDAAHHLGDERDRVVLQDRPEVCGQDAVGDRVITLLVGLTDERASDAEPVPGRALDLFGAFHEQPVDGRADRAVAE
jgi:hypothetical protein